MNNTIEAACTVRAAIGPRERVATYQLPASMVLLKIYRIVV